MSVYSGFATRNQQMIYDNLLYNIISALSIRLMKFYENKVIQQRKFRNIVQNQFRYLRKIQKRKYIQPKYAEILQDLLKKIPQDINFNQFKHSTQVVTPNTQLNRTLSMVTTQFKNLRDMGQKQLIVQDKSNTLEKISERLPRGSKKRKKSKMKKEKSSTLQLHDLWKVRAQKMPQISNFKLNQDENYKSRIDWGRQTQNHLRQLKQSSSQRVKIQQQNLQRIMYGTKFRSKMYIK